MNLDSSCLLISIFFSILTVSNADYSVHDGKSSLKLVAIIFRHGLRAPSNFYRSDPYKDEKKYWPEGLGQLTLRGKRQMYKQGKIFHQYYREFITEYSSDAVRVNSSDKDRCHMSAALVLAGWFPPTNDHVWNKSLKWQPIPIHSVPADQDREIGLTASCPRYDLEKDKVDKEIARYETAHDKWLYKYLTEHIKQNVSTPSEVGDLYKIMQIEERNGLSLPQWVSCVYPEPMRQKAALSLSSWSWNAFMKRITGGPLLKDIISQFTIKSEKKNEKSKLFLYSGHEDTVIAVWRALGFREHKMFDFGSSLIFELHQNNNSHFIKIYYMDTTIPLKLRKLKVPGCGSSCLLKSFANLTKYVRNVNWNKDCPLHGKDL